MQVPPVAWSQAPRLPIGCGTRRTEPHVDRKPPGLPEACPCSDIARFVGPLHVRHGRPPFIPKQYGGIQARILPEIFRLPSEAFSRHFPQVYDLLLSGGQQPRDQVVM